MATGFQETDCEQPGYKKEEYVINDESTTSSIYLGSDDDDDDNNEAISQEEKDHESSPQEPIMDVSTNPTGKTASRQFQRFIKLNKDVVKFISKRGMYSKELSVQLEKLHSVMLLMPDESCIKVTKKPGSKFVKDWRKRCCSKVKGFCGRFRKDCLDINEAYLVRTHLPKLGDMLRSTTAAYWIENNNTKLAVMTEQKEREQVLAIVKEFLQSFKDHGFQKSGQRNWRKHSDPGSKAVVAAENNPLTLLNDERSSRWLGGTEETGNDKSLKQLQKSVKLDNDIVKFLMKRKQYFEKLKAKLASLGAAPHLKPGFIRIDKMDSRNIDNWGESCESAVVVFCNSFHKKCFELDESIRESHLEALPTLQKDVSSTGAACWLDSEKKNVILVSPILELRDAVEKIEKFIKNVGIFAKRSFKIEESIHELVEKELPPLKDTLKSCTLALEKETLVVVCVRSEIENTIAHVESFLSRIRLTSALGKVPNQSRRARSQSKSSADENSGSSSVNWRNKNSPQFTTAGNDETRSAATRGRPIKLEPISVKINNDVVKFAMNNTRFAQELKDQLAKLNGELQWKPGIGFVTVIQKSEDQSDFVPKWSEKCKSVVTRFFQRFRKESYEIQGDVMGSVCKGLESLKESILPFDASCWLASNNRWLVLVGLKDELSSVVKVVECFLQSIKEESQKNKEIVKFVVVSSDHVDYLEHTQFLDTLKQNHPEIVEANITQARNQIRFVGTDEAILTAKREFDELVKELNVIKLELPLEVVKFVSQEKGLDFIEKRLSEQEIVSVILVETKSCLKVVAKSLQECEKVKECLCHNIREATISLPLKNDHIFSSKKWYDVTKAIDSEELVDYQINFERTKRRDIKLHGAKHLVEKYQKIVDDFIDSRKIESCLMPLPPGIARFMKEKLGNEVGKIETDLKEEQVTIEIHFNKLVFTGTEPGLNESKKRILKLRSDICTESKEYTSVGMSKLFSSENGRRNIKGIEADSNIIIVVADDHTKVEAETWFDVGAIRTERLRERREIKQVPVAPVDPFDQCNFTTREGLAVSWKYGNIARERADILVSSAVSDLNHPTMVGRVLNSVGGPSYVAACSQHDSIEAGDIATTIGGDLPCSYVIHAVCSDWKSGRGEHTLRGLLQKILVECTRLSARTVAMPLIGTGNHKFPEDVVLRVMREEIEQFSVMAYHSSRLKEIKLVRYDQGIKRKPAQPQLVDDSTRSISRPRPTFVPLVTSSSVENVKLQVYARSNEDITPVFIEIQKFIDNHIASKTIEAERLFDVVLQHWDKLQQLAKDECLRIACVNETTVSITGLLSKVLETKDKLTELVNRHSEEQQRTQQLSYISQTVQWYYCDLRSTKEMPYKKELNGALEIARMNGKTEVEITELDGEKYNVDFAQMVARNKNSGQTRKLTRKLIGSEAALPSNWTNQSANQVVQLVRLAPSSPEYLEVLNHFVLRGGKPDQLYYVERIQNPQLYSMYMTFKKSMRGQINEMRLFHGTDAANVDSINAHNFSRSFAGVNGVAYGNGVYFARDASYSIKYACKRTLALGSRGKMYMAKVLVGEYTRGASGMKAPPPKNDPYNPGLRYDSVVDHPSNPTMYVIFQDNQYYPEYLLTLR
ncbi:uncharacterized protein LOC114535634 [Dendronephthya gigantea]|uniref:uncharacterized protein LOC114535634 n=1 Tax=Dendronephthya gigantea TaxID=151771 RepID=UPI00106DCC0F|nr:uncharacterized protein LOC114535634 [Dendronephthya gigantea]